MRRLRFTTSLSSALVVLACAACGRPGASAGAPAHEAPLMSVTRVATRSVPVEVSAPIELRAMVQTEVGAKMLGYLEFVLVDRGDHVTKGQLLATVRPSDLRGQHGASLGLVQQTRAALSLARDSYRRAEQLAPEGLISKQELQQAKAALLTAQANASAAQAQLAATGTRLQETQITAPMDGVVAQRRVDQGGLVGGPNGSTILTLMSIDTLRAFIPVGEREAPRLELGQRAYVEIEAVAGHRFPGSIARLSPAIDPATRTRSVEVHLRNPDHKLLPGMYGRGTIVLEVHKEAVTVPDSAVVLRGSERVAFVWRAGHVQRREVVLGVDGGSWVEILSGLRAGEEVVAGGAEALTDGAEVRPVRDDDIAARAARSSDYN